VIVVGLVVAGAIGAPLRYLVDAKVSRQPWGTFVINVTGSFVLGLITGAVLYHAFPNTPKVILGTGLCGAYTTFSTFTFETVRLVEEGDTWAAARYLLASVIVGVAAAAAGLAIAAAL